MSETGNQDLQNPQVWCDLAYIERDTVFKKLKISRQWVQQSIHLLVNFQVLKWLYLVQYCPNYHQTWEFSKTQCTLLFDCVGLALFIPIYMYTDSWQALLGLRARCEVVKVPTTWQTTCMTIMPLISFTWYLVLSQNPLISTLHRGTYLHSHCTCDKSLYLNWIIG